MSQKTIPPILELREICQSGKFARDKRWFRVFWRKLSIYMTWVLLHTGITANQVTVISILLALVATVLLAFPSHMIALCGALVYLIYHMADKIDGEIARYYQKFSIVGVYLDELGHNLSEAGIFVGLGLHLAWQNPQDSIFILTVAAIGALSMIMIRSNKSVGFLLFAQNILVQPELLPAQENNKKPGIFTRQATHQDRKQDNHTTASGRTRLFLSLFRNLVLAISQSTVMFLLVIIGLVVELYTHSSFFLEVLIKAEALLQAAVLLALVVINIKGNISSECLRINEMVVNMPKSTIEEKGSKD